jgi:hypothetical protein
LNGNKIKNKKDARAFFCGARNRLTREASWLVSRKDGPLAGSGPIKLKRYKCADLGKSEHYLYNYFSMMLAVCI